MLVEMWDWSGSWLIIRAKTGVHYTNQVAGTFCKLPRVEGFVIPFSADDSPFGNEDPFVDYLRAKTTDKKLESALAPLHLKPDLSVSIFHEAWIPVVVNSPSGHFLEKFDGAPAVLTYVNSD